MSSPRKTPVFSWIVFGLHCFLTNEAISLGYSTESHAAETPISPRSDSRLKAIDFEEDLVEGLNKRPLDSLQSLKDRDRRRKAQHLYRKRASYRLEILESVREKSEGSAQ